MENLSYLTEISRNETAKLKLKAQPDMQALLQSQQIKEIMENPQTVEQIQNMDLHSQSKI